MCVCVHNAVHVNAGWGVGGGFEYRLWVRQWSEPIVVLLSRCIPKAEVHWFPIHHHIGRVVVKAAGRQIPYWMHLVCPVI